MVVMPPNLLPDKISRAHSEVVQHLFVAKSPENEITIDDLRKDEDMTHLQFPSIFQARAQHLLDMRLKHADRLGFEVKIMSRNKTPLSICQIAEFCLSLRHRTQKERLVDYRILGLSVAFCVLFLSTQRIDEISDFFSPIFACVFTFSYIEEYTLILNFRFKIKHVSYIIFKQILLIVWRASHIIGFFDYSLDII